MDMNNPYVLALMGTAFTFLMTTIGAATVFLFKKGVSATLQSLFLGFAAGVMIAASVFSLLVPAIEQAQAMGIPGYIPATLGFLIGAGFLYVLDHFLPHLHPGSKDSEGPKTMAKRTTLLMSAVTLHNIPEGMAVGLSFALSSQEGSGVNFVAAFALAIGIGLQNLPEGAAISLPLYQEGYSKLKAFIFGSLSGIVEPIAGVLCVFFLGKALPMMPWLLSFAAGAMIYVVVEELIPEANLNEHSHAGTFGVIIGFAIMMALDVALG